MPIKFREMEKILLDDGWIFKKATGSHYQYVHPVKPGKVTIPRHGGDIDPKTERSIRKYAGLSLPAERSQPWKS